jgi:hypothetical protein
MASAANQPMKLAAVRTIPMNSAPTHENKITSLSNACICILRLPCAPQPATGETRTVDQKVLIND